MKADKDGPTDPEGPMEEYTGTGFPTPGCRTAPGACNWQEIDVYVARADGLYLYEPHTHELRGVLTDDVRPYAAHPAQPWVAEVPVVLIYVADLARMTNAGDWDKSVYPYSDASFLAENVYLYCASSGLATVVRALMDRPALAEAMRLRPEQLIALSQPVGYPE
jgi:nitroreductase